MTTASITGTHTSQQTQAPSSNTVSPHRLVDVTSEADLAKLLRIPLGQLRYHAKNASAYYSEFKISKRSGGVRQIYAPRDPLKAIQRTLARLISAAYKSRRSAHGFLQDRSIVTNAEPHVPGRLIFNVDLEDFFPSIHRGRVIGALRAKPFNMNLQLARLIAAICCLGDKLPQGAPTSPILSNVICWSLDRALERFARQYRCYYTRYADDITFSTTARSFPAAISAGPNSVGNELKSIIIDNGFTINNKKVRLSGPSNRKEVTGIVINEFPNTNRRFIRQVRAMLHAWETHKLPAAQSEYNTKYWPQRHSQKAPPNFERVLLGKINFVGQVRGRNDSLFRKLLEKYASLSPGFKLPPKPPAPKGLVDNLKDCTWVLESAKESHQGTGFMLEGIGLVTCAHVLRKDTKAFRSPSEITKKRDIEVLCEDKDRDIAILKVHQLEGEVFPSLKRGSADSLKHLDQLIVAGFPDYGIGDILTVRSSQVSSLIRRFGESRIRLNTGIVAGMSGGPVVHPNGDVVGIAVTGADWEGNMEREADHGAIPIDVLERIGH